MKKIVRLTESDLIRIIKQVINENSDSWSKFPCVAKGKDVTSPTGRKGKKVSGTMDEYIFFSDGRCVYGPDGKNAKLKYYNCCPGGVLAVSEEPFQKNDCNTFG